MELPGAGANSKTHHCKQKVQELKDIPNTWVLMGKQFEDFRRKKKQKHYSRPLRKTQWSTRPQNVIIGYSSYNQEEVNRIKIEKAFRIKLLEI